MVVEYMDRAQGHTVNFSAQNLHLTQSAPGKIDPTGYGRKSAQGAQSAVRGADRCGRVCQVTLSVHSIDADDIFGILSAS